ncbi:hypothetical protein [Zunongwangia atlantica]|uniref:Uncharacterized protein n=2 Tax=Zunongwangia TaxID=417127 RepID=A0A1Y1T2Z1_9FLAO|nr:hypothetical protein [Zunongwangia atlantica]ORL45398.1 hypothetical protein IIF7_11268 [Zunongwangia atlantica 22II14-10F7]
MAYDLTNFNDYIARQKEVLTATLFSGGDTGKFARFITNVKGSTEIPYLFSEANPQAGTCVNPTGDVTGETITLSVKPYTEHKTWCNDDLQTKFPATELAPGSMNNDAPKAWEEALIDSELASVQKFLELTRWQGDTAGSNYTLFDGFIKKIDANSDVVDGNTTSATEITIDNVRDLVDEMRDAAPIDVRESESFVILVGNEIFDLYIKAEKKANLYHYEPEHKNGEYRIGGSGATLMKVRGLAETKRMFASIGSNFVVGVDSEADAENIKMVLDEVTDKTHLKIRGKDGVQIVNPQEIVEFTLSV